MSGRNRQHDPRAATAEQGAEDPLRDADLPEDADSPLDPRALRARLREKERLVEALTERLEQTAEQLDRARRTGNRDRIGGGGAVPPELIEGQREVLEELHEAIDEWRTLQGTTTLGQIEMQIAELRDLVAGRVVAPGPEANRHDHEIAPPATEHHSDIAARLREFGFDAGALGEDPQDQAGSRHPEDDSVHEPGDEPTLPEPVDFETADADGLIEAIRVRDEYVAWLIRKLRHERARKDGPIDVAAFADAPDELRERLTTLIGRLEENLRLAEIEFSMERARLSREESQLRLRDEQLRRLARQYELAAGAHGSDEDETDPQRGNRWLRMLGLGREDEDSDR
ncbi:MAG: hypothetical protein WD066_02245 [Planctomycetaceae bacterium]